MAKISKGMVNHLNMALRENGVGFKYVYENEDTYAPTIRIDVVDNASWISSSIINCTDEYYSWLENWFEENYDIEICYNNTRSIIWSKDVS